MCQPSAAFKPLALRLTARHQPVAVANNYAPSTDAQLDIEPEAVVFGVFAGISAGSPTKRHRQPKERPTARDEDEATIRHHEGKRNGDRPEQ